MGSNLSSRAPVSRQKSQSKMIICFYARQNYLCLKWDYKNVHSVIGNNKARRSKDGLKLTLLCDTWEGTRWLKGWGDENWLKRRCLIFIQVLPVAQSLNSSDVFVLHNPHHCFIWVGKGSIGDERECAREVVRLIWKSDDADLVMEGKERDNFWNLLGGKADYGSAKQSWVGIQALFLLSLPYGKRKVELICANCFAKAQERWTTQNVSELTLWTLKVTDVSIQYHPRIKDWCHENKGNGHQQKQLSIV